MSDYQETNIPNINRFWDKIKYFFHKICKNVQKVEMVKLSSKQDLALGANESLDYK